MKEKIQRLERDKQELEQTLEALSQEALQVSKCDSVPLCSSIAIYMSNYEHKNA